MCQPGWVTSTESDAGWGQRSRGPGPALRKPTSLPVGQLLTKCCEHPSFPGPASTGNARGGLLDPTEGRSLHQGNQTHYREDGRNEKHNGNITRSGKESWYISPKVNNPLHKWVIVSSALKLCAIFGTSLVVQRLRLCAPNAGGPASIPGQGTIAHMWQPEKWPHVPQLRPLQPNK